MKKLFLLFLIAAFATACNNDSDNLKLNHSSVTLTSGETVQITPKNANDATYSSENEYIATVSSDGLVKGLRIGQVRIKVSTEKANAFVSVAVRAVYDLYEEPYIEWGTTRTQFLAANPNPFDTGENTLVYTSNNSEAADKYKYYFEDDKLVRAEVSIYGTYSPQLDKFLSERYVTYSINDGNINYTYIDALERADATTKIEVYAESTTYWIAAYSAI